MTRLTVVELRRISARRMVWGAIAASIGVVVLMLLGTWSSAQPMSAAELEQAETFYQTAVDDWAKNGEQQVADCVEQEALEQEASGNPVDFGCDQMAPQRDWYVWPRSTLATTLPGLLANLSLLLVLIPLLIGATSTAAEISTGALSNWLTFEPRRLLVYGSKLAAAALSVVPVAVGVLGLVIGGAWLIHDRQGLADTMTSQDWAGAGWTSVRILALAVIAALVGAALGFLLRHTGAVLGLAVGYGVVVEGILAGLFAGIAPWLVLKNLEGWTNHGTTYWVNQCTTDATGTSCETITHELSFGHSATYVLVLTALVVVVGAVVFRRRDAA